MAVFLSVGVVQVIDPNYTQDKTKVRRDKSREAIALTLEGDWERATEINQDILHLYPDDVEALNRLGKAFLELGRYSEAKSAFETAAQFAPYNTISKKNLERLAHLQETMPRPSQARVVTPRLFIEESGKSAITVLQEPGPRQALAKVASGDSIKLECRDRSLVVFAGQGEYLGQVESKLGVRLMRLMKGGNRYDAAIISVHRQEISVIIWEAYRHPDLSDICSFQTKSKEDHKVYWRDALLRYDIDSSLEEEDEFTPEWRENYHESISDGEESGEPLYIGSSSSAAESHPDEEED